MNLVCNIFPRCKTSLNKGLCKNSVSNLCKNVYNSKRLKFYEYYKIKITLIKHYFQKQKIMLGFFVALIFKVSNISKEKSVAPKLSYGHQGRV